MMTSTPRPTGHPSPEGISDHPATCLESPLERGGAKRRGVVPEVRMS